MSFLEDIVANFKLYRFESDEKKKIPGLTHLTTIIPGRLYFGAVQSYYYDRLQSAKNLGFKPFFTVYVYKRFERDFGPYNLAIVYLFCKQLHKLMESNETSQGEPIVHLADADEEERVNSAFLMGCYAIIYLNHDVPTIMAKLRKNNPSRYRPYRDASFAGICEYPLHLQDCLKAIHKSIKLGFFDISTFDLSEYFYYEEVKNGDLNWIIPGKLLAFCGPTENLNLSFATYSKLPPSHYFEYFTKTGVTTVVRLNKKVYDAKSFTNAGFAHKDLFFPDGTTPDLGIVEKFLEICENTTGAVAVHCKAGLGRTGTLIACYLMKHYRFTAAEAIAWIRICRPGSIIGPQQQWLVDMQPQLWSAGKLLEKNLVHNTDLNKKLTIKIKSDINGNDKTRIKGGKPIKSENGLSKITCELKKIELKDASNQLKKIVDKVDNNTSKTSSIKGVNEKDSSRPETQGDRLNRIKVLRDHRSTSQPNEHIIPIQVEGRSEPVGRSVTPNSYSIVSTSSTTTTTTSTSAATHHPYNTRSCSRIEATNSAKNVSESPVVRKSTRSAKGTDSWRQVVPVHEVIFDPPSSANSVNLTNNRIIKSTTNIFRSRGRSYSPMRFSRISPFQSEANTNQTALSSSKQVKHLDSVCKTDHNSNSIFFKNTSYSSTNQPVTFSSTSCSVKFSGKKR